MVSTATMLVLFGAFIICCVIKEARGVNTEGFEIKVGELNTLNLEAASTATTNFVFTTADSTAALKGTLDSGETITGSVNTAAKTAVATVPASSLINGFGTFLVTWELKGTNGGTGMQIQQVIFYEEPIEGFQASCSASHVLVGEEFNCTLTFTKGTNIEIEYFFDENTTCLEEYNGTLRTAIRNYTYTSPGEYNITKVVANTISRTFTSNIVNAQYSVEGFGVTAGTGPVQTTESVTFTVTLAGDAKLPMGNIYLEIDYGNSETQNISLNAHISTMQQAGYKPTKQYSTQGNFTVSACIKSEISSQCIPPFEVYVWDNVVACLNADSLKVAVDKDINLNFINTPASGFQFYIDNGDGTFHNNTADVLGSAYVSSPWTKKFTSPGIYKMISAAWNPFYVSVCELQFIVQYPIVEADITLTPATDEIPVPDGLITMTMTLTVNHPTATNVTCSFDNGDTQEENVTTEIAFGSPIVKQFNYTTPGQKDINFTCINVVSSSVKTATIQVKSFTLSDFKILHIDVASMNMSETTDDSGFPASTSDLGEVEFVTALFACSHFPPGVSFLYGWGDGETHTESEAKKTVYHKYKQRGTYSITVDLTYNGGTHQITSSIILGLVTLTSNVDKGEIGVTQFTLTIDGLGAGGNYLLNYGDDASPETFASGSTATKNHQYTKWGVYNPFVIATNSSFYEKVYLTSPLKVDYLISDELQVVLSNETIDLPPGIIITNVTLKNPAKYFPRVTCEFLMGDDIDKNVHNVTDNITDTNSLSFNYTYGTLGPHEIKTNCCNFIDCFENTTSAKALNPCFEESGMFDRQYSNPAKTPMGIFTSTDVALSNRMGVKCWYLMPQYRWILEKVMSYEITGEVETAEITYDPSKVFSANATFTIKKGGLLPGLYKLCLNVTLTDTWAYECTYLKCRIPKPRAMIVGGAGRILKAVSAQQIDAFRDSYNCEEGLGEKGRIGLNYTWFCYKYKNATLEELTNTFNTEGGFATFANSTYQANNECGDLVSTTDNPGIINLNTTSLDYNAYIVVVAIDLEHADRAYYAQNIQVVEGDPPTMSIKCLQNCREKVSTNEKVSLSSTCDDCTTEEKTQATYLWNVQLYDPVQEKYIATSINSDTGTNGKTFVINANSLEAGKQYKVTEFVTVPGRSKVGEATYKFATSYAPYGGYCSISPTEGNATTTKFAISCPGWMDEGSNLERDPSLDGAEPLFYHYIARRPQLVNNAEQVQETLLTSSSESTATNIPFQVGDENFNYTVKVLVRICDRLGSCNETEVAAQVKPDVSFLPSNANDTAALDGLLDSYNSTILQLQASGNQMAVARYIGSAASMLELAVQGLDDPNSPVVAAAREKNNEIILTLAAMVSNDSKDALSVGDAGTIMANINQAFQNPQLSDDATSASASQAISDICSQMLTTTSKNPYPVDKMPALNQITEDVVSTVENLLSNFVPPTIEDLDDEITLQSVYDELYKYNGTSEISAEEEAARRAEAQRVYDERVAARASQSSKKPIAPAMMNNLVNAVKSLQSIRGSFLESGEPATVINRTKLMISVEKNTLETFTNRTEIDRGESVKLTFGNTSLQAVDDVQLQVAVFNDIPFFYGKDASKLSSKSIMVSAKVNGTVTNVKHDLKITNEGSVQLQTQTPKVFEGDEDKLWHFVFYMPDDNDAVFVYYMPLGFDMFTSSYETLARLICYMRDIDFASVATHDCSRTFEVRDYEHPVGFKMYFQPGCIKQGEAFLACKLDSVKPVPLPSSKYRRRRRSVTNNSTLYEDKDANFSLIIATTGCRTWNAPATAWESTGCEVLSWSTINDTICRCPDPVGNMFGTTFFVPPNKIDFNTVWSKFDPSNAAVYGTIIGLLVVYALVCIWARREDKKDFDRWATHFLVDSDTNDVYFYLISVHTGLRRGAGTKSNVNFVLAGDEMDSGVRIMSDGIKQGFDSSSVRKFFMGTPEKLGELTYLRIWHDNSGAGDNKGWYLHKVVIDDPQTSQRYVFMCDKWLAAEYDDGAIERLLPVCGTDNLVSFDKLFSQHARFNLTENHLWLSMIMRPEQSSFTRVQRLSCIMALLFLTMIANAMFFKSQDDSVQPDGVQIGSLRFSLTTIYISMIGILITTPPVLLMTYIFRKAKIKIPKKTTATKKYEKEVREIFQTRAVMDQSEYFSDLEFYSLNHLPLPHWTIYIAWVVTVLAVLTSAFFLILYSMEWGKPKSEEWLSTFVFSFVESLFFVDPVKVILIAVLFALLFKKPVDNQTPTVNMNRLKEAAKLFNAGSTRNYLSFRNDVLNSGDPPSNAALEKARLQRKMEMKAQEVFMELILYVVFAFIIYSISYINRDQRSFNMRENIYNALYYSSKTQFGFNKIKYTVDYQKWLTETLFPLYFPEKHFDNSALDTRNKQFFYDLANMRIGPARLRQVRMKRGVCDYGDVTPNRDCVPNYDDIGEETNDYCIGWNPYNSTCANNPVLFTDDAWRYQKATDIWGIPIAGDYDVYGGGGYILKLDIDLHNSILIAKELNKYKWINRETRAVFTEFTLYNGNINLFAYAVFLAEFTDTGGIVTWTDIRTFRPYQHTGGLGTYAMVCYFIYLIVLIVGIVKTVKKLKREGCKFFADIWNVVDTLSIIISFVGIVMWTLRYIYASESMERYRADIKAFINFQHVVVWDYFFTVIIGILVFIATIRILRILGYNKRMTQLAAVIANASADLSGFAVVFGIVFFAYVSLGYLLFGIHIKGYKNLFSTTGSLTNALIGKNSLDSMIEAVPSFSQLYYFTYVFFVILTLMTMFAVILNTSISEVRADLNKVPQAYGILDILTSSIKDVIGIAFKFKGKETGEQSNTKRHTSEYIPAAGKRAPDLDAPNILRIVRETFGDKWEDEEGHDAEEIARRKQAEKQLLILDSYLHPQPGAKDNFRSKSSLFNRSQDGESDRAGTPGDIRLTVETPAVDQDKLYSAYL